MARSSKRRSLANDVTAREVWAWAMYDFANSGYTTVVITAVFNAYFVASVAGKVPWATFAWTAALSVSYALNMVSAPIVGAYADAYAAKKKLLLLTTLACVLFTAALALVGPGDLALGIVLIILSNFFYSSGENLIAAFLPELANSRSMGKVSGWGWSLGYLGGLLSLGVCLAYVSWAQSKGQTAGQFVPVTMLITAALYLTASIPTFLYLRERAHPLPPSSAQHSAGWEALNRIRQTLEHALHYRDLRRFLICLVFYQAGIQAVVALAGIYAQQAMGFSTQQTIMLILVVNVTAAVGAFLFGNVQDRIGHTRAIALTLAGWLVMIVLAWGARTPGLFWLAANIAGLCLGASQSAGRALVGVLSPPARLAEFFGLWGLASKLSFILGPITYGLVNWLSGGDHRLAILITGSYFLVGLLILAGVDVKRGRRAALQKNVLPLSHRRPF
ncbi:MAG: MFS transporter [Burkholderiales bacterium]